MEKEIQIPTRDDHIIYGVLNSLQESSKLIIFVHGLTGHKNEHIFYNASRFFTSKGFDTFRFDLYSGEEKARRLRDTTIRIHSQDLDEVIAQFKGKYSEIFLIGHSLGGPTILGADLSAVKSVVLWDPSLKLENLKDENCVYNEELGLYVLEWGVEYLISSEMVKEWSELDLEMVSKIVRPTKIICAGNGILHEHWLEYIDRIGVEHDFVIVEGASHCFDEEGCEERLFEESLEWVEGVLGPCDNLYK